MSIVGLRPAIPTYGLGQIVRYSDHTGRIQTGTVLKIEATWGMHGRRDGSCYISVTVSHPTYRNNRIYLNERDIIGDAEEI